MIRPTWVGLTLAFAQAAAPTLSQAQPSPLPGDPSTEVTTVQGEDESADGSTLAPPAGDPEVPALDVDDPMLEPVAPPEKILTDWREALRLVKTRSTSYLRAQAQVDAARGQSRIALANVLPTLIGSGQYNYHIITAVTEPINGVETGRPVRVPNPRGRGNIGLTLTVPVINARNWYDYATTRKSVGQAELQRDDAERLIIGGLAESIVTVVTTERLAEVTRVNLRAALSTLELNKRRTRLGAGNAIDVLRAQQEVARSRAQVVEADESLRKAREALGQAMGYSEPFGITPDIKMDRLREDARDTCRMGDDPEARADVRAAAAGAAIAERNVKSVYFGFVPNVNFVTAASYSTVANFAGPHTTWTIGGTLTWHLYDGGRRYGERDLNQALAEQRRQDLVDAQLNARLEATQSARGVTVARAALEIAEESQSIAEDNARLSKAKFVNGSGTSFDMIDTQRTAREAALDVTVKEFELLRAEIIAFLALASCDL